MSFEHELLEQRYQKIRQLEELGFAAYPRKYAYTHTLGEIRQRYDHAGSEELAAARVGVCVCGRLVTVRRQGKAGLDRKSTRLNSSHSRASRMPSSA